MERKRRINDNCMVDGDMLNDDIINGHMLNGDMLNGTAAFNSQTFLQTANKIYTIPQLKIISKRYKLKVTGTKPFLINNIYNHLLRDSKARLVQKVWRKYAFKLLARCRGPAKFKRALCVNDTDFFTMEPLAQLPLEQFFSYSADDGHIYGFEQTSLQQLYDMAQANNVNVLNPYNRQNLPYVARCNLRRLTTFGKIFQDVLSPKETATATARATPTTPMTPMTHTPTTPTTHTPTTPMTPTAMAALTMQTLALALPTPTPTLALTITPDQAHERIMSLFTSIDNLGNYTDPDWFLELDRARYMRFLICLNDIWSYRANLSDQVRREICPTFDPFHFVTMAHLSRMATHELRFECVRAMEILVLHGNNHANRTLGSHYVLCALTLVSRPAALALPWLYESVAI